MSTTFKPAKRENVPLLIGIDGASGSGKTYSAQLLAAGIAEEIGKAHGREGRVFGIDTERGRMTHYSDYFSFMHGEINPPFRPQAYGDAIATAEKAGADVIIIDSFSHCWEGEGGVLEWARALEANGKKPPANWMEPKQAHKRLVNQMLAAGAHVIVCMRSEEKMRVEAVAQFNDDGSPRMWNGKPSTKMVITPSSDLPLLERWVPICEKRFPFEITTSLLLTPDQPGVPVPRKLQEQHRPFFPEGRRIGREAGAALARWSMGGATTPASGGAGEPTLADVERDMRGAGSLPELETVWRRKSTAPFRDQLQPLLSERKEALERAAPPATSTGGAGYDGV